jgi:membrane-bound metal-dependent hydrolase YbcI (DUF457 family)
MMGRSHLVLAGAAYAALYLRPIETPYATLSVPLMSGFTTDNNVAVLVSFVVAAACGLAPDIDKRGSWASRSLGLPTRWLSWGIEHSFGHRGGFHSLLGLIGAYLLGNLLGTVLGVEGLGGVIAFGWAMHLLTDAWTVHGIPLFWPLPLPRLRLPPWLSTGTTLEAVMLIVSLGALTVYALGPMVAPLLADRLRPG